MNKKVITLTIGAGMAAGTVAGLLAVPAISGAQTSTTDPAAATTPMDKGRPDRAAHLADAIAPLVADGTITRAQADAVIAALEAARPDGAMRGPKGGPGLDIAAQALGMSADDLHAALRGGQTLAQVAEAQGVDVQVVIDAMVAERTNHINDEVASGEITQEEADQKLADLTARVTDAVNNGAPQGGRGGRGGHGPHGPMGDPADAPADDTVTN